MKEKRVDPTFGGFHVHVGEVVGCVGPRVEVPAVEHAYLVQEAERFGCKWLASLRHSHPDEAMAEIPGDGVLRELDVLLGDARVDDRAREAAKRLRALWDGAGAGGKVIVACGVGDRPHVEPRWTDLGPMGVGFPPKPTIRPIIVPAGGKGGAATSGGGCASEADAEAGSGPKTPDEEGSRIDFFPYGAIHRGPGPHRSKSVAVRGCGGVTVTAWAGLDLAHPWAGAVCWMEVSEDEKTWVVVGDRLMPRAGGHATAAFVVRAKWVRATVEVSDPEAEVPLSVFGSLFRREK